MINSVNETVSQSLFVIVNPDLSGCGNLILSIAYEIASLIIFAPKKLQWAIPLFSKEGSGEILRNCIDWKIPLNPPLEKGEGETVPGYFSFFH